MPAPLLYRPSQRWQIFVAFGAAVLLHVGAVALAARKTQPITPPILEADVVIAVVESIPPLPPPTVDVPDIPAPPPPPPDDPFPAEVKSPPARKPAAAQRSIGRAVTHSTAPRFSGSPKVTAIRAPRPEYPYEARRQRLTGSGVAILTVDPATGFVLHVGMSRSTGSPVLDHATVSGFRRWRFKPGTVSQVQTPITYTLTGASY